MTGSFKTSVSAALFAASLFILFASSGVLAQSGNSPPQNDPYAQYGTPPGDPYADYGTPGQTPQTASPGGYPPYDQNQYPGAAATQDPGQAGSSASGGSYPPRGRMTQGSSGYDSGPPQNLPPGGEQGYFDKVWGEFSKPRTDGGPSFVDRVMNDIFPSKQASPQSSQMTQPPDQVSPDAGGTGTTTPGGGTTPQAGSAAGSQEPSVSGTGPGDGSRSARCKQYARVAARQVEIRKQRTGTLPANDPAWSDKYDDHYTFCLKTGDAECKAQMGIRIAWLKANQATNVPAAGAGRETICQKYARFTMQQVEKAKQTGRMPGTQLWSADTNYHYSVCMTSGDEVCKSQFKERQGWLEQNVKQASTSPATGREVTCRNYAAYTMKQIEQRKEISGSLPKDRIWSDNYRQHLDFCMKSNDAACKAQLSSRQAWLNTNRGAAGPAKATIAKITVPVSGREQTCQFYAKASLRQVEQRKQISGTLPGNDRLWSTRYEDHYSLCMKANEEACKKNLENRQNWIKAQKAPVSVVPAAGK